MTMSSNQRMMVVELEMELLDVERKKKREKRMRKCERLYNEMIEELKGKSFTVEFWTKEGGGWKVEGIRTALEGAGCLLRNGK